MIYFVRHGQTDWNKIGKIQGHIDIELNNEGKEQAQTVKEKLSGIKFDKVFSSPLKRAKETAKIICDQEIIIDDRLIERFNGELEGKLKKEIKVFPDFNNPNDTRFGIEPLNNFKERINSFLDEILKMYKDKNILVVTHAGVCLYVRCYFEGEPDGNLNEKYKLKNCEVLSYKN
ncbi:MAG: histidine phosphatase family protein [Clostridiales bacterium]|nr:histidine phosphatase family protein [Clostridiales bacterium]